MKRIEKPWGAYENIGMVNGSNIKLITVNPNQRLSLQSHEKRSELWTVLAGTIIVETRFDYSLEKCTPSIEMIQTGGTKKIFTKQLHRMTCYGNEPAVVLEVSFGEFDENDIKRYEDDYGRTEKV